MVATILVCMLMPFTILLGQATEKIAGTVVDSETGEPLPGVNVV